MTFTCCYYVVKKNDFITYNKDLFTVKFPKEIIFIYENKISNTFSMKFIKTYFPTENTDKFSKYNMRYECDLTRRFLKIKMLV